MNIAEDVQLSSTASMRTSLKAIYDGEAGLTERRKQLLNRVPNSHDWAVFEYDTISIKDIAYLSAATHHEFALLRGKTKDILFHGVGCHCNIIGEMLELLKQIGQKESIIVSYITGKEQKFSASLFEN